MGCARGMGCACVRMGCTVRVCMLVCACNVCVQCVRSTHARTRGAQVITAMRGHDDKVRIILNKADSVDQQELMRVYGALMWSLGKVRDGRRRGAHGRFMHGKVCGVLVWSWGKVRGGGQCTAR